MRDAAVGRKAQGCGLRELRRLSTTAAAEQPRDAGLGRKRLDRAGEAARRDPWIGSAMTGGRIAAEGRDHRRSRLAQSGASHRAKPEQAMRTRGQRTASEKLCRFTAPASLQQQRRRGRASLHDDIRHVRGWLHRSSRAVRRAGAGSSRESHGSHAACVSRLSSFPLYDGIQHPSSTNVTIGSIRADRRVHAVCLGAESARVATWT